MTTIESDIETRNCQQRKNINILNRRPTIGKKKKKKSNHMTLSHSHIPTTLLLGSLFSRHTNLLEKISTCVAHSYLGGFALAICSAWNVLSSRDIHTTYSLSSIRYLLKVTFSMNNHLLMTALEQEFCNNDPQRLLSDFSLL